METLTLLFTINFSVQLLADFFTAQFADRLGYRVCVVAAHIFVTVGLVGFSIFPYIFPTPFSGLVTAVILNALGGGIIEVLISPIIEACPIENKTAAMGFLHSFYCWGTVGVILLSTVFFSFLGPQYWRLLPCIWALLPAANAVFFAMVQIQQLLKYEEGMVFRELFSQKVFWVLIVLMLAAGASEITVNQWSSAYAERGLGVSKAIGDIAGPCLMATTQGISRVLYSKYAQKANLLKMILLSGICCTFSYFCIAFVPHPILSFLGCGFCGLSVGILWPCVFNLASVKCPRGGTALFAFLALAGDAGGSIGSTFAGMIASGFRDNISIGLGYAAIFPIILTIVTLICGGKE